MHSFHGMSWCHVQYESSCRIYKYNFTKRPAFQEMSNINKRLISYFEYMSTLSNREKHAWTSSINYVFTRCCFFNSLNVSDYHVQFRDFMIYSICSSCCILTKLVLWFVDVSAVLLLNHSKFTHEKLDKILRNKYKQIFFLYFLHTEIFAKVTTMFFPCMCFCPRKDMSVWQSSTMMTLEST